MKTQELNREEIDKKNNETLEELHTTFHNFNVFHKENQNLEKITISLAGKEVSFDFQDFSFDIKEIFYKNILKDGIELLKLKNNKEEAIKRLKDFNFNTTYYEIIKNKDSIFKHKEKIENLEEGNFTDAKNLIYNLSKEINRKDKQEEIKVCIETFFDFFKEIEREYRDSLSQRDIKIYDQLTEASFELKSFKRIITAEDADAYNTQYSDQIMYEIKKYLTSLNKELFIKNVFEEHNYWWINKILDNISITKN